VLGLLCRVVLDRGLQGGEPLEARARVAVEVACDGALKAGGWAGLACGVQPLGVGLDGAGVLLWQKCLLVRLVC
jgi:hypothetical protein